MTQPAGAIEGLAIARAMREHLWLFPAVETVHIIGFSVLVGAVVLFDLRVLGLNKDVPVTGLARHLLPWSLAALLLIVPTGLLMFATQAAELLGNRAFQLKMALLAAAGMNALYFHTGPYRGVAGWNTAAKAPAAARASVALSIALWFSILACGRWIAFV